MAKWIMEDALAKIDEEIARLQRIKDDLTKLDAVIPSQTIDAPKPKRTRGKNKPKGLPETIVDTMVKNQPKF